MASLSLVKSLTVGSRLAIFSTANREGQAHATWMQALVDDELREVIAITSPDSDKVVNLKEHAVAEWLFTSPDQKVLTYLSGPTATVDDVKEIKRCWNRIPDPLKAPFLAYYNSGIGFTVIRTVISSVVLCFPAEFKKVALPLART